ncbi:MAG: FtsX-like permease family protein [Candidatus Hodarchaeales archaeon]|jgi:ABC-type antimicrobial peptide transport system permease subunit
MSWLKDEEAQKKGFSSKIKNFPTNIKKLPVLLIRELPISIMGTLRSIRRYKRRSLSMIAGLILGISILAGIFIYSTVLQNNVYDSIIQGSPAEIRFDFDGETLQEISLLVNSTLQELKNDDKVSDVQLVYGNAREIVESTGAGTTIYNLAELEANIKFENNESVATNAQIISSEFLEGKIGERFKEQITTGTSDLFATERGIYIDATTAESKKISVGTPIESITLEIDKIDPDDPNYPFSDNIIYEMTIENLTIEGVIGSSIEASAGLFDVINEGFGLVYIPDKIFIEDNQTQIFQELKSYQMQYALVKIDETKFSVSNPGTVNSQLNTLINKYELIDPNIIGTNLVSSQLLPFQILSYFIFIFDALLTLPVVILSLYLLSFGIDLSLSERGYFVGVLKTQGASPKQIKRKIFGETLVLALLGLIVGYILAIFGGWAIGTAKGFLSWDTDYALSQLNDFMIFDSTAFYIVGGFVVIILLVMVNSKINKFINLEITETVRVSTDEKKENWLKRNNLDIAFFIIGMIALIISLRSTLRLNLPNFGIAQLLIEILGPFLFWIGGSAIVARLAVWLPDKTDPIIKRLGFSKDIAILIKANVLRKSGDIPRLALIISLTVSFAILANVQGQTGEAHDKRVVTWNTGSDLRIQTNVTPYHFTEAEIKQIDNNVESITSLSTLFGTMLKDSILISIIDTTNFIEVGLWQGDNFPDNNRENLLANLNSNPLNGGIMGRSLMSGASLKVGDEVPIEITSSLGLFSFDITILGTFDHLPGGIGGDSLILDNRLINSVFPQTYKTLAGLSSDSSDILTDTYLVKLKKGITSEERENARNRIHQSPYVQSLKFIDEEIEKISKLENADFGIPGLLTADFVVSLMAATLGVYIFMSILLEKRKKEFAILRSYGATQTQIYKIVVSETIVLLLTAVLWGLLIGLGLTFLFNGFFEFINLFLSSPSVITSYQIKRILIFDPIRIFLTLSLVFVSMLIATFVSLRGAVKANIVTQLRQL